MQRIAARITFSLLISIAAGCSDESPPHVIVVLVDALRADHLGTYGYERPTSPRLDEFARESLVFASAHAQSPWTKPSVPTLFTSLYPMQHGVYEGEAHTRAGNLESDVLAEGHTTLAERFAAAGYSTLGLVNNAHLEARHGFAQGFDVYEHGSFDALEINRILLEFIDQRGDQPLFAYLHYLDVHWPFHPGASFRQRLDAETPSELFDRSSWKGLRDGINDGTIEMTTQDRRHLTTLHDAGIAEFDDHLGSLIDELRDRGFLDNTILLLTSDHGEELLDHGRVGHGGTLYREVIEIPLLLRLPRGAGSGRSLEPARLLDVVPTLLAAAGLPPAHGVEGRNLLVEPGGEIELVAETRHKRTYRASVRSGEWKYVRTHRSARSSRSKPVPEAGALTRGMRVKATGLSHSDGALHAFKLRRKEPGDDDLEVSGTVERLRGGARLFAVQGIEIDGRALLDANGQPATDTLSEGDWIKVEGVPTAAGVLIADKLERLLAADQNEEIEGIVDAVDALAADTFALRLGPASVIVDAETHLKGSTAPRLDPRPVDEPPVEDPFSPTALLSGDRPPSNEQLFDLAADPEEKTDLSLAPGEAARLEGMRHRLDAWLTRMERHAAPRAERESLSAETVEELRRLGYLE